MSTPYAPNSSVRHNVIHILTDNDAQRAQAYNPPLQELADNQAYVEARTLGRIGTSAQMIAKTGVVSGDLFIVPLSGTYYYLPSFNPANGSAPWVYPATGMGSGAWLHSMFGSLLGGSNPPQIASALLPPFPSGDSGDMAAITDAVEDQLFILPSHGVYRYRSTFGATEPAPWVYPATGMGSGAWVHSMYLDVFGNSNPPKILNSLLNEIPVSLRPEFNPYIVARGHCAAPNFASPQSISGNVWTKVSPNGLDLQVAFSNVTVGDRLDMTFGPLETSVAVEGITKVYLRAKVTDGTAVAYYPVSGTAQSLCLSRRFNHVVSEGPLLVELYAYAYDATVTHVANSEFASFQWAQYVITRDPAA